MYHFLSESINSRESVSLTANFTFAARDSKTGKSAKINPILPENINEKLLWQEAEERNKMRKKKKEQKIDNLGEKENMLNELLLANSDDNNNNNILIKDTCLQNSLVCQPEQRNIHGQIFGGYLMRKAFELAYATAYSFVGSPPCFVEVDHVDFLKPVSAYSRSFWSLNFCYYMLFIVLRLWYYFVVVTVPFFCVF